MLTHGSESPKDATRVVVLGAGFIGGAAADALAGDGIDVERLGRKAVDLLAKGAGDALAARLRPDDVLMVVAAEAPCKNGAMLERNIKMMNAVVAAADDQGAAVVLVGSRGRSAVREIVLGSVAMGVLHGSHRPVMVVPNRSRPNAQS